MPWCRQCGRLVEEDELSAGPPGLTPRGPVPRSSEADEPGSGVEDRCPTCGTVLELEDGADRPVAPVKAPWHFKVLVVGTVVYLGYRLYQGIGWLIHHA